MPRTYHGAGGAFGIAADSRTIWAASSASPARRALSILVDALLFTAALLVVAYVAFAQV